MKRLLFLAISVKQRDGKYKLAFNAEVQECVDVDHYAADPSPETTRVHVRHGRITSVLADATCQRLHLFLSCGAKFEIARSDETFPSHDRQAKTTEPQPCYNQHPKYEEWKNICPNCRGRNTSHANNRQEEFNVLLRCLDCGFTFDLEQAFKAEHQRQLREKAGVA